MSNSRRSALVKGEMVVGVKTREGWIGHIVDCLPKNVFKIEWSDTGILPDKNMIRIWKLNSDFIGEAEDYKKSWWSKESRSSENEGRAGTSY